MRLIDYFVCFYRDQWVGTHSFDLLTKSGNTIEMSFVVSEINGHNIRLVIAGTPESAASKSRQRIKTLLIGHLVYEHCCLPLVTR